MVMTPLKFTLPAVLALTACDAAYVSQSLPLEATREAAALDQADFTLDIQPLTPEVTRAANGTRWQRAAIVLDAGSASGTALQSETTARAERLPPNAPPPVYRIGVGDVLTLAAQRQTVGSDGVPRAIVEGLSLPVLENGTIFAADIGTVNVLGRTLDETRALIAERLAASAGSAVAPSTLPLPPTGARPIYKIGAGDILSFTQFIPQVSDSGLVSDVPTARPLVVSSTGSVTLLGAGDVTVEGMTTEEAIEALSSALLRAGLNPEVELSIQSNNSQLVRLMGDIPAGVTDLLIPVVEAPVKLVDVIGGLNLPSPNGRDYLIRLRRGDKQYGIAASALLENFRSEAIYLHPGDVVVIEARDSAADFSLNITGFNSQSVTVTSATGGGRNNVLPITTDPLTLADALRAANVTVDRRSDVIARISRKGSEYRVSARRVLIEDPARDIYLQADDRIVLEPVAYDQQSVMITGAGTAPRLIEIEQIARPSLADAVFSSGAMGNDEADLKQVFLLRLDHNDHSEFDAYYLDLSNPTRLALANDLQLRPDDIIFVSDQPVSEFTSVTGRIANALRSGLGLAAIFGLTP